jgi:FkbM family methyltransferase
MIIKKIFYRLRGYAPLRLKDRTLTGVSPLFRIGSGIEAEKILEKDNEEDLLTAFLKEIRPGDIVYDIGANIGLYSLPSVLKLKGTGKVIAFEPVPPWFDRLKENIALNGLGSRQVVPFNIGLSYQDETCEMIMKGVQGSGMGGITAGYRELLDKDQGQLISVRLVRGDDFIATEGIPQPNIVKIDVEGAELQVLQGLEKSIGYKGCRFILCEVHPHFMPHPPAQVEELLREYGFALRISEGRRSEYHILARKE